MADRRCGLVREAISAQLDGERGPAAGALDEHLASCRACSQFAASVEGLCRRLRVHAVAEVPDLSASILARATVPAASLGPVERAERRLASLVRARWRPATRWAAALLPLAAAVPVLAFGFAGHLHVQPAHRPTPCTEELLHATFLVRERVLSVVRG